MPLDNSATKSKQFYIPVAAAVPSSQGVPVPAAVSSQGVPVLAAVPSPQGVPVPAAVPSPQGVPVPAAVPRSGDKMVKKSLRQDKNVENERYITPSMGL